MMPPEATATADAGALRQPADDSWMHLLARLDAHLRETGISPARTVVLVPYAQLMANAREAWRAGPGRAGGYLPRFESTRNWAQSLRPFDAGLDDLTLDPARDSLAAERLLLQAAGSRRIPADLRGVLVARLCEAAAQLAPLAAAVPPAGRADWVAARRPLLAPTSGALAWESLVLAVALEWAGASDYPTDVLWTDAAQADLLVVLQGLQPDPLAQALAARWATRPQAQALCLPLVDDTPLPSTGGWLLHPCGDAEDEAQRAAACVLAHLEADHAPVALVALDRLLSRRVCALLAGAGVSVKDETGWKLSTTRAAAQVLALLRAATPDAGTDAVLDALKQCPRWPETMGHALERDWRRHEVARWAEVLAVPERRECLPEGWAELLVALQAPRPLADWLDALTQALHDSGLWPTLETDAAGQAVLRALWLGGGTGGGAESVAWPRASTRRLSLGAFSAWVREVLEGASFAPPAPSGAAVVVLPMAQLLGRRFAAVVAPGCDDAHLSATPEAPGDWSSAQRAELGLPDRERLAAAAQRAWGVLLRQPRLDLLWRQQERDEPMLPSPWVQVLVQAANAPLATDPRTLRALEPEVVQRPQPSAPRLLPQALSASAYQDLRDCPYRFFALRQLALSERAELEAGPDKRDLGNWLHAVLRAFHEHRPEPRLRQADAGQLDHWADSEARQMGLADAAFLPFRAVWPALRERYLDWLHGYETQERARFEAAEVERRVGLGRWALMGKLDRIDRQASPEGEIALVIDYKTESRSRTEGRVKNPMEDTQLAFYAALLPDETLRAAYLSLSEGRDGKAWIEQTEVLPARDALREGLPHDLDRIASGHPMPALGEGAACEYCAARGLCRKDFWTAPTP